MLAWIICMTAGLGYQPGLTWIPWVVPMAAGQRGGRGRGRLPGQGPLEAGHAAADGRPQDLAEPLKFRSGAFLSAQAKPVPLGVSDHHPAGCVVTVH